MNASFRPVSSSFVLILTGTLLIPGTLAAQPFATLYSFSSDANINGANNDGANPGAGLIQSGATLYGTTWYGGVNGYGTIFKVNTNGAGFAVLHQFAFADYDNNSILTNGDGVGPSGLILAGNTLYGTASQGGTLGNGTVFRINLANTNFTLLHTFTEPDPNTGINGDGGAPSGTLLLAGDTLYGAGENGGNSGGGVVFALNTNGGSVRLVATFPPENPQFGNTPGSGPAGTLALSGTNLYGTCKNGGGGLLLSDNGTLFRVSTNGFGFAVLHTFTATPSGTNSDGAQPQTGLLLVGARLYGTTTYGGPSDNGVAFSINLDGSGFTNLHGFSAAPYVSNVGDTNSDGARPNALIASGDTLYGTAASGGTGGAGTVFALNTNGATFETLHSFSPGNQIVLNGFLVVTNGEGVNPSAGLLLSQNTLFGAAYLGGPGGSGTLFDLTLSPPAPIPLDIALLGNSVVLTWTNNAFNLEAASSLNDLFTNVPNATSPYTNPIAGPQEFFRLISQ